MMSILSRRALLAGGALLPFTTMAATSSLQEHTQPLRRLSHHTSEQRDELLVKKYYLKELTPLKKNYQLGDDDEDIIKIKQWLMLWQLDENSVTNIIDPDHVISSKFDNDMEIVVKEIQAFLNLPQTVIVDAQTWQALVKPLKLAFSINSYRYHTLQEKQTYFALRHVQYRSAELEQNNIGPWVRSYMDGADGTWYYWCQGLACTILDQTFSSIGEYFDEFYRRTWLCEEAREHAKLRGLLVTHEELKKGQYIPNPGDLVFYISAKNGRAHHTETILDVPSPEHGVMRTVGGNTNFAGSRNGVGTFIVDRNFLLRDDEHHVEIAKLISHDQLLLHQSFPVSARKLLRAYPEGVINFEHNTIVMANKKTLSYHDNIVKNHTDLLINPTISEQFSYEYPKGPLQEPPKRFQDPGRITNQEFFKALYGSTQEEVEKHLTEIIWCPKLNGQKIKVTTKQGVDKQLKAISAKIDQQEHLKPYVMNIGGTYKWRLVSGTNRLSLHSFGIAIDLNVAKSNYWQWDNKTTDENAPLNYVNHIPYDLVKIFEDHGFIWGGKWYHYDTMHFEYRPELLL